MLPKILKMLKLLLMSRSYQLQMQLPSVCDCRVPSYRNRRIGPLNVLQNVAVVSFLALKKLSEKMAKSVVSWLSASPATQTLVQLIASSLHGPHGAPAQILVEMVSRTERATLSFILLTEVPNVAACSNHNFANRLTAAAKSGNFRTGDLALMADKSALVESTILNVATTRKCDPAASSVGGLIGLNVLMEWHSELAS